LALAPFAPGQEKEPQSRSKNKVAEQLLKLEREWLDAYEKHDIAAMERIESDDFILTDSDGKVVTKAQDIDDIRKAAPPAPDDSFGTRDVKVRVYGEAAVLTGFFILKYRNKGILVTETYRYTDTYISRNNRWQVVSSHLSRVKEP
jgi:ketosteroid isomerase-like protein